MLILHGIGGSFGLNWYQYIAREAEANGYKVYVPQLPSTDRPNLNVTYEFLQKTSSFDKETILIGHSSRASLSLGILQLLPKDIVIKRTILVAGFIDPNLTPELHKYIPRSDYAHLFPKMWDWDKIRKSSKDFIIFYSPQDPFIQSRHAETLEKNLNGKLILVSDALHFSVASGGERFREFPELLKYI